MERRREERNWKDMTDGEVMDYYNINYRGFGANKLNKTDPGFYKLLCGRGLLHPMLPNRPATGRGSRFWADKSDREFLEFVHSNFPWDRRVLRIKHPSVYETLRNRKLLGYVPLPENIDFGDHSENDKVVLSYLKTYGDLDREQLQVKYSDFYGLMKSRGLLGFVPFAQKTRYKFHRPWRKVSNNVVAEYYRVMYKNKTPHELSILDRDLLVQMHSRGLLSKIYNVKDL